MYTVHRPAVQFLSWTTIRFLKNCPRVQSRLAILFSAVFSVKNSLYSIGKNRKVQENIDKSREEYILVEMNIAEYSRVYWTVV